MFKLSDGNVKEYLSHHVLQLSVASDRWYGSAILREDSIWKYSNRDEIMGLVLQSEQIDLLKKIGHIANDVNKLQ